MILTPNTDKLIPSEDIVGHNVEDTALLRGMLAEATEYLAQFEWCPPIRRVYFGCGLGGVVAVFLFHFSRPIEDTMDEWLWVIIGDLPTAHLVVDQSPDPGSALVTYCRVMHDWAQAILEGRSPGNVFPVKAAPTKENALALVSRLEFIKAKLIPLWRDTYEIP